MSHQGVTHLDAESPLDGEHPIFSKDPSNWMMLVHTHVRIKTEDGMHHTGWVYTVDPVSESIVLVDGLITHAACNLSTDNSTISLQILIGHSIAKIESLPSSSIAVPRVHIRQFCDCLFRPISDTSILCKEQILKRKSDLKTWLEKHRIPVSFGGHDGQSLSVLSDALIIQPPYTEESCLSTNEIILSKIQGLVKSIPQNIEIE